MPEKIPKPTNIDSVKSSSATNAGNVAGNSIAKKVTKRNPAFQAMGIPNFKLPNKKWMSFWTFLGGAVGLWLYDRNEQKQIRSKYCQLVEKYGLAKIPPNVTSRKLTVYITPPPNDYLSTSMKVWRRYIKPIFYTAGLDYDVFTGERQGSIRIEVSGKIRELRRKIIANDKKLYELQQKKRLESSWKYRISRIWQNGLLPQHKKSTTELEEDPIQQKLMAQKYKDEFDYKNLLGVYYQNDNLKKLEFFNEDSKVEYVVLAGGVVCLGRGAYKEYIQGVHEGLLGPINTPEFVTKDIEVRKEAWREEQKKLSGQNADDAAPIDESEMPKFIPKPFISPENYATEGKLPGELVDKTRALGSNIPFVFRQPILEIPHPKVVGFLNIPRRIYRFYTKRYEVETFCREAASVVLQKTHPFTEKDLDWGKFEEDEWPARWVQTGIDKHSEWVQPLVGDARVYSQLTCFDPSKVPKLYTGGDSEVVGKESNVK
ncbi:Tim22-complex subunit TIM54 SCDLUD_003569 [Saccharomycodes ludwigii]|uniref:Tim22-complex subunit TIM54 n=1 Tax=Saccharomycodes ludwigii TaxID=36035 RepID=UPI001E8439F2|nr:hypothetical protein SCDLUD_003569 [Saccharomycodes ludwigii]KAH3900577.1 hypothetical protein SCDLUD_003569 [Saccharomycodes ludwigii]